MPTPPTPHNSLARRIMETIRGRLGSLIVVDPAALDGWRWSDDAEVEIAAAIDAKADPARFHVEPTGFVDDWLVMDRETGGTWANCPSENAADVIAAALNVNRSSDAHLAIEPLPRDWPTCPTSNCQNRTCLWAGTGLCHPCSVRSLGAGEMERRYQETRADDGSWNGRAYYPSDTTFTDTITSPSGEVSPVALPLQLDPRAVELMNDPAFNKLRDAVVRDATRRTVGVSIGRAINGTLPPPTRTIEWGKNIPPEVMDALRNGETATLKHPDGDRLMLMDSYGQLREGPLPS